MHYWVSVHSLLSHLSKFYRRQRLTSRVGGVGYLRDETSRQICSSQSRGPELRGCTAGRLKGDGAVGSTAGAWWRPSSNKCYFYCRVWSVGSNSDVCTYMILHSVTIHLHKIHQVVLNVCVQIDIYSGNLTWVLFEWVWFWLLHVLLQWVTPYWWIWAGLQSLVSHPRVTEKHFTSP